MIVLKHIKMENSKKDGINHRGRLCHIRYCTGYIILGEGTYSEVIVIGINGTDVDNKGLVKDPSKRRIVYSRRTAVCLNTLQGVGKISEKRAM